MLKIEGIFSENELKFINILNEYFQSHYSVDGRITNRGEFVRYEFFIGESKDDQVLVLQFCVRDEENLDNGECNFVHISNILVPPMYGKQGIATNIISLMSYVARRGIGIEFFITGIVNEKWKRHLIQMGGIEDQDGDIQVVHERWIENWYNKYGPEKKV